MTTNSLSLNGTWDLTWNDDFPQFLTGAALPGRMRLKAAVPASVHQVLMDADLLDDPRIGMNSLRARWVEEQFWSYRRTFTTPENLSGETPAWLVFDRLEYTAVIYLNGEEVGRHANAHRPARIEVTGKLRTEGGENLLVVLLETGIFADADKPGAEYRDTPQAKATKIHWHRKGQWQRGWDWQQRLLNVGILGDARLEWSHGPLVEQWQVYATVSEDLQTATVTTRVFVNNPLTAAIESTLSLSLSHPASSNKADRSNSVITLPPGLSSHIVTVDIVQPLLWWPLGHGEQHRYNFDVRLHDNHDTSRAQIKEGQIGIRKVEVDQSPHPVEGRHFILKVNNRPIFCKGGNWVPADMLYSTVTPERYRELVDLALEANFNLLRIWGGGIFADPALLDYCDAKGVLIWHDLLFACSKYPGDYPSFAAEVRREVTWTVREMAHHASLVVWCGNNEIEEGDWHWGYDNSYRTHPHYALFHHDLPQIVTHEDPSKFYWISSPYSPDYKSPRDPTVGDQHPWKVSLQMPGGADWWEYRTFIDRFPNEGGVLGCSSPATLRQFLPEKEQFLLSPSWEHHDNPFAINDTRPGLLGHAYQTVELWTGLDPLSLDLDRYAYVSGLLQAEGLTEYITNFRRRMFSSAAAIFWMYNDSWPVTHGWTIVDYYRRKKLAYHPVRRAFAPVTVVVAQEADGSVCAYGINDTMTPWHGLFLAGTFQTGNPPEQQNFDAREEETVTLPPNASVELYRWPREAFTGREREQAPFACLATGEYLPVAQHRLLLARFHELPLVRDPEIDLRLEDGTLTLTSDVFVWGVCLDLDSERPVADNCFDLLPGVPYALPWDEETLGSPTILRHGNKERKE